MDSNRSTLTIFGALVGLIILILVIFAAVGTFREGAAEMDEQSRAAGRPITLAETVAMTETTAMTETAAMTEAAAVTETTPVTTTAEVTATTATTETAPVAEAAAVTTTTELTATAPATTTAAVTATETTTASTEVTATAPVTETVAVTETAAVTTEAAAPAAPAAAAGEAPAEVVAIVTKATCFACHVIPGIPTAMGQVGPNLTGIGTAAATRVPGQTAEQYLMESIMNPNAFIAPKCPTGPCLPNVMLQNLAQTLTPAEIDSVVAYLASLK